MVKTQIQIPDHLYREAKRIAEEYEMSFAEVVRRGIERVVGFYPRRQEHSKEWELPLLDLKLQRDPFADPDWRQELNLATGASGLVAAARRRPAR
jgi:capsid portal protein